jgi:hypothetical protein
MRRMRPAAVGGDQALGVAVTSTDDNAQPGELAPWGAVPPVSPAQTADGREPALPQALALLALVGLRSYIFRLCQHGWGTDRYARRRRFILI